MTTSSTPSGSGLYEGQISVAAQMIGRVLYRLGAPDLSASDVAHITVALTRVQRLLVTLAAENLASHEREIHEREAREWQERANSLPEELDGKRRSHMLRLIAYAIEEGIGNRTLPREMLRGLDDYIEKQVGAALYESLNAEAKVLLEDVQNRKGKESTWAGILAFPPAKQFALTVLYRICIRFVTFERAHSTMTAIITRHLPGGFQFGRHQFIDVMTRFLEPLRAETRTDEGRAYLEFMLSPHAVATIAEVSDHFDAWVAADRR